MIVIAVSATTMIINENVSHLSKELNLKIADETAYHHGLTIQSVLEKSLEATKMLEISFWQARNEKLNRSALDKILIDTIHHDKNIFGTWMLWEPNAYDQLDENYANTQGHEETGRVNSYWHWEGNTIINEPNTGWETSSWYSNPRKRAKETLEEPYFYQVSNQEMLLISTIQPIIHDSKFHGVVGIDVKLDSLQGMVRELKLMDSGYSMLVAFNGMFVAHPNTLLIGTYIDESRKQKIQLGEKQQLLIYDESFKELAYQVIVPITIGNTGTPWAFIVSVPMSKVISSGDSITQKIFLISAIAGLLMLLALFIFVEKLIAPISSLTEQLALVVETKQDVIPNITIKSRDEVGKLAYTFNTMADDINNSRQKLLLVNEQVYKLNSELEDRVKARTTDLENALEQQKAIQFQLVESEKMASLGRLVAGVAHELNTPLGICVTANSVLIEKIVCLDKRLSKGKLTKSELEDFCQSTLETAKLADFNLQRASELIQNFKMVSIDVSAESSYVFNIVEYAEKVIQSLSPVISKTQHKINITSHGEININCDPGFISQILTNIVMNALTHAFPEVEQGSVIIDIYQKSGSVYIICQDNGIGMTESTIENVFEPFYTTNRENGGSGLGMHIVYNIVVQKLKGQITCENGSNCGTCYTISFPLKQ